MATTAALINLRNLADVSNAATARTNLGIGTIATQAANAVAITGGTLSGITALTVTGQQIISTAGAASTPPFTMTGTWFTGGSATTTKPQLLIEPTGATSTGWNTAGTGLGVNAVTGFTGNLIDLQINGVSRLSYTTVNNTLNLGVTAVGNGIRVGLTWGYFAATGTKLASTEYMGWVDTGNVGTGTADVTLFRDGAANTLALRNATAAQTFHVYNTWAAAGVDYERIAVKWETSVAKIGTRNGGTGTARVLSIDYGGTTTSAISVPITSGNITFGGGITTPGGAVLHTTNTALTDGAGVGGGTLLTAPAAGNPTKWIGINDNGTTRYVPAW